MIDITDKAAEKTKEFMAQEGKENLLLRLAVVGGGCSGLSYSMMFEENQDEGDILIEKNGVKVIVDEYSLRHVDGSTIDYIETLMGAGYKINNPNITSTCSCEHSFSTE